LTERFPRVARPRLRRVERNSRCESIGRYKTIRPAPFGSGTDFPLPLAGRQLVARAPSPARLRSAILRRVHGMDMLRAFVRDAL
jgi:hypothetical protein